MRLFLCVPLAVRIVLQAQLPAPVLEQARQTAARIFTHAGIEITWAETPDVEAVQLQIVNKRPSHLGAGANGYTILPHPSTLNQRYAAIFYPAVRESALQLDADDGLVLGAALAHEIGHILLGNNKHGRTGVMVPRFEREHMRLAGHGLLWFTAEESQRLRAALGEPLP